MRRRLTLSLASLVLACVLGGCAAGVRASSMWPESGLFSKISLADSYRAALSLLTLPRE